MIGLIPSTGRGEVSACMKARLLKLQIRTSLEGAQPPDRHAMGSGHWPVDSPIELISALDRGSLA